MDDRFCYDLDSTLRFEYADKDSVLHLENDDYYGSDFDYMIHLTDELLSTGHCKMDTIVNGASANFFGNEEDTLRELTDTLDDGTSWAERLSAQQGVRPFVYLLCDACLAYS